MYRTCYQHKGFIRHRGPERENERERETNTAKTMHYLPRKFYSSAPEGMLFWKSIFLPWVSSSNIMRWPLNKAPKPKHSGKHSHTKVISLTELNHFSCFWKKKKKRKRGTGDTCMPVFERWAAGGRKTWRKTKYEKWIVERTDGQQHLSWAIFQMSFTQIQ